MPSRVLRPRRLLFAVVALAGLCVPAGAWAAVPAPTLQLLATSAALLSSTSMAVDHTGGLIVATTGLNQLWTLVPASPLSSPW